MPRSILGASLAPAIAPERRFPTMRMSCSGCHCPIRAPGKRNFWGGENVFKPAELAQYPVLSGNSHWLGETHRFPHQRVGVGDNLVAVGIGRHAAVHAATMSFASSGLSLVLCERQQCLRFFPDSLTALSISRHNCIEIRLAVSFLGKPDEASCRSCARKHLSSSPRKHCNGEGKTAPPVNYALVAWSVTWPLAGSFFSPQQVSIPSTRQGPNKF